MDRRTDIAQWYKSWRYQCVVITDHEHLTPVDELNKKYGADDKFLVLRGQEITQGIKDPTSSEGGIRWSHVNGIDINKAILPIGYPNIATSISLADTFLRNIDEVYKAGGIPQINHPSAQWGPRLEDLLPIQRPFVFEVWNAFPSGGNLGGTDDKGVVTPSFEELWDQLLSHGKTAWAVASDDVHDYVNFGDFLAPLPGRAWIVIQAPKLTEDALMGALRDGHFYASNGVFLKDYRADAHGISITIDPPLVWNGKDKETVLYKTRFVGRDGRVLAEMAGLSPHYEFKGDEEYVRASVIDSDGLRAWTQPVFLKRPMEPQASAELPYVDDDGATHFPNAVVPYSDLASKELKAEYLAYIHVLKSRRKEIAEGLKTLKPGEPSIGLIRKVVDEEAVADLKKLRERFTVDIKAETIAGVYTNIVVPSAGVAAVNRNRVLINLHGGGMQVAGRSGGQAEAVPLAGMGRIKVVAVDYRMAPEYRFPAASEDVAKVYTELLKSYRPENIGIYGCSSGAELTAESVAWFQTHRLPRPGAISMMGGSGVVYNYGDSNYVSAALGGYPMPAMSSVIPPDDYFAGANLGDPMVSPGYSAEVLKQFPPSQFISGIRDMTLSGALYTHSRMVDLGLTADLHVWEGAAHCFPTPESPEGQQAFRAMTRFFDRYLGTKAK